MTIIHFFSFFAQPLQGCYNSYVQLILRNMGYSQSIIGVIIGLGIFASIIVPFIAASIAERTNNEKLTMFFAALIASVTIIPMIFGFPTYITALSYFISAGSLSMIMTMSDGYINKCVNGSTNLYGKIRGCGTLGYVVCLAMFSILNFPDNTNNKSIYLNILIFTFLFSICLSLCPSVKTQKNKEEKKKEKFFDPKWFDKSFYLLILIVSISQISMSAVEKLLPSYMTEVLGLGSKFIAFVALSAVGEFFLLVFGGKYVEEKNVSPVILISIAFCAIALRLFLYSVSENIFVFAIAQILHTFCFGSCQLGVCAYISRYVDKSHTSVAFSIYWTLASNLPMMIGTFLGGFIIDGFGYHTLFGSYISFALIALSLTIIFRKKLLPNK